MNYTQIAPLAQKLNENISRVIVGKQQQIELILTALLSGGHVLLEDVPGTGKTTMAKALAKSLSCQFSRVQFTPDLLPALKEAGVSYRGAGENIAWGQKSPEEVMKGWMNSAGHRANILNERFTAIGVGYHQNNKGVNYWSQLFIY